MSLDDKLLSENKDFVIFFIGLIIPPQSKDVLDYPIMKSSLEDFSFVYAKSHNIRNTPDMTDYVRQLLEFYNECRTEYGRKYDQSKRSRGNWKRFKKTWLLKFLSASDSKQQHSTVVYTL